MICVDGDHLTIPFVFIEEGAEKIVLTSVLHHLVDMNIDMLTTYHPKLNEQVSLLKVPHIFKKKRQRNSLISKKIDSKTHTLTCLCRMVIVHSEKVSFMKDFASRQLLLIFLFFHFGFYSHSCQGLIIGHDHAHLED